MRPYTLGLVLRLLERAISDSDRVVNQAAFALEYLESRIAPATLVVTNALDDGSPGSLRAVIGEANNDPDSDTIVFSKTVFSAASPQKITLNIFGEILINNPLVIKGPGRDILTIDGNAASRIFEISDGTSVSVPVSLSGFTVSNGNSGDGGAIRSTEPLSLTSMAFLSNTSTGDGGGLHVTGPGPLNIKKSVFSGNSADSDGGGIYAFVEGSIKISSTLVTNNMAMVGGGGARLEISGSADPKALLEFASSTVSGNSADYGGGLLIENNANAFEGKISIKGTKVTGNTATNTGGGLYIDDGVAQIEKSTVSGNTSLVGGGIFDDYSMGLSIKGSQILENRATSGDGGGLLVASDGPVSIQGTLIVGNSASGNGAGVSLYEATSFFMKAGMVSANSAGGDGGGIKVEPSFVGSLNMDGTKLDGNSAAINGGGIQFEGTTSSLQIKKAAFLANRAADGGAIHHTNQSNLIVSGSSFVGNLAMVATYGGGAILSENPGAVTISGSLFEGNATDASGGAFSLFNSVTSPTTISKSKFLGNVAPGSGGAAFLFSDSDITLDGNSFFGNSTSAVGGALTLAGSGNKVLSKCTLSGNSAQFGGAIHINPTSGQVTLLGGAIIENVASASYGAIRNISAIPVQITGTKIADNMAFTAPNL